MLMKPSTKHKASSPALEDKETELEPTENTLHRKLIDGNYEEPVIRNDVQETEGAAAVPQIVVSPQRNYSVESDNAPQAVALSFADMGGFHNSDFSTD